MISMVLSDFKMRRVVLGESRKEKAAVVFCIAVIMANMANLGYIMCERQKNYILYMILMTYWFVAYNVQWMYPTSLSKMLFLVPMNKKERLSYLKSSFWLKQVILCSIFAILCAGMVMWKKIEVFSAIAMNISFFILMIHQGAPVNKKSVINLASIYCGNGEGLWGPQLNRNDWREVVVESIGLVGECLVISCYSMGVTMKVKWGYLLIGIQILCVPWIIKNWKKKLAVCVDSGNMQRMLGE